MKPIISLIAALDEKRGIGKNNRLLFKISEDMKRFRKITEGHVVIMGRKTFESIGHPLPNRTNIVVTRDKSFQAEGCIVVHSLEDAFVTARSYGANRDEIFIIGGGELFKQSIDRADKLYLTIVKGTYDADTFFPEYKNIFAKIVRKEEKNGEKYMYSFVDLIRG